MEVLIHIGCARVGSSYLQAKCARTRSELSANSCYFPVASRRNEAAMQAGRISSGNAADLAMAIIQRNVRYQEKRLEFVIRQARAANCSRVLLSSEWLLAALAAPNRLHDLSDRFLRAGAVSVNLLLMLRDPVDQLISLYKHRAKQGTLGDLSEWARINYVLPKRLEAIRHQISGSNMQLTVRGYQKSAGWLEKVFFRDWLGLDVPLPAMADVVNPSLTLSELRFLRALNAQEPSLVTELYTRMAKIESKNKQEHHELAGYARAVAESIVSEHREEWERWNMLLPQNEVLAIPKSRPLPEREPEVIKLSAYQLQAVSDVLADISRARFLIRLMWRSRLRPVLARIKAVLLPGLSRR